MPLGEYSQDRLGEADDGEVSGEATIVSNGRQLRPITALLSHIVSELKLHVTPDGLWTTHTEPANVAMATLSVYDDAFESYELDGDEFVTGVFIDTLDKTVQPARKPSKDPARLRINPNRSLVTISREYSTGTVEWTDRVLNFDPQSARKEPDLSPDEIMDKYIQWTARVEVNAFFDAMTHVKSITDYIEISEADGRLTAHSSASSKHGPLESGAEDKDEDNPTATAIDFGPVAEPTEDGGETGASSLFSIDYLVDQITGLKNAKIFDITVGWGEECPLVLLFEKEDEDENTLMEGGLMLAPRIKSDD